MTIRGNLCPGTGSKVTDFVLRSMLSSERLFFKLLLGFVILSLELVFLRCKFLVLFTKTFCSSWGVSLSRLESNFFIDLYTLELYFKVTKNQ